MTRGFTPAEYRRRIDSIAARIRESGVDGALVFDPFNVFYLGLYYHPGKRPVILYVHHDGTLVALTPAMEAHEARKVEHFAAVDAYEDNYAAGSDLYDALGSMLRKAFGPLQTVAVDQMGLATYRRLTTLFPTVVEEDLVAPSRVIKSDEEIAMLKLSAYYSDHVVASGRKLLKPGVTELGLLNRVTVATTDQMIADLGEVIYVPGGPAGALVPSGPRTALPHALPSARALKPNEPMMLSTGANVWGYRTECERTFFVGSPTAEWRKAFEVMRRAQELGISLMQPGTVCEEVDREVAAFIAGEGYGDYIRHRTGHGKGLEEHEAPYIAKGDRTVIQPGMIFSSEPGIYIEGFSGFRHSDIVWVSPDGPVALTQYPKDIDSMVVPL